MLPVDWDKQFAKSLTVAVNNYCNNHTVETELSAYCVCSMINGIFKDVKMFGALVVTHTLNS